MPGIKSAPALPFVRSQFRVKLLVTAIAPGKEMDFMTKPKKTQDKVASERFELIAQLTGEGLDKGLRHDLVQKIAEKAGVSERTVRRWVESWRKDGFDGLKPASGYTRPDARLPEDFSKVVAAAIELRCESPARSVNDIIKILEMEEAVAPGTVARSTLQRKLQEEGFSAARVRMYVHKGSAARRFQKEHRGQLWQGDVKYGPFASEQKGGRKKQLYLVVWIDDATRFIVCTKFYTNQGVNALEDSFRTAIQKYGAPDAIYVDNGSAYRSDWLKTTCAKIDTKYLRARPYHAEGKGKVEAFNRIVGKFMSEAALKQFDTIAEYNEFLSIWLSEYYHKNKHSGLCEISPGTAFAMDTRPFRFVQEATLRAAFLHSETRKVDKIGCISHEGSLYEVGLAYIGLTIEIRFDASWDGEVEACPTGVTPFRAKKQVISENCGVRKEVPESILKEATTSRMLDGLKKEHDKNKSETSVATSFKEFWEEDSENV
jgi:transposase InsO family protein